MTGPPSPPAGPVALLNAAIRPPRRVYRWARFRLWTARLALMLRRRGGRLVLEAPHEVRFDSPPHLEIVPVGDGDGTTTLRIGRGVTLGRDTLLVVHARGTNLLEVGDMTTFRYAARVELRDGSVRLGRRCFVRDLCMLRSSGELTLGDGAGISDMTRVHCTREVTLAALAAFAERTTITDSEHTPDGTDDHFYEREDEVGPVRIGRNVFAGAGAVLRYGVTVGPNAAIGANAVLGPGEYPGGWLIAGNPARAVRALPGADDDGPGDG